MSQFAPRFRVVAVGTWLYDDTEPREIELICGPDRETGTPTYMVGWSKGSGFTSAEAAKAWTDGQPWGPVMWREADYPAKVVVIDDD